MVCWAPTQCSAGISGVNGPSIELDAAIAPDAIENLKLVADWMERAWFEEDDSSDIPVPDNWVVSSGEKVCVLIVASQLCPMLQPSFCLE